MIQRPRVHRGPVWLFWAFTLWGPVVSHGSLGAGAICPTIADRLDPAIWDGSGSPIFGRALGQTFLARDTLITRLTLWRPPNNRSAVGAHLFITTVDAMQSPPFPVTQGIVLDGPTVLVYDSSPPGQLIEMSFVIDPPLALPRPGMYAFFLQAENCNVGSVWSFIGSNENPYPHGIFWDTGRAIDVCHLARAQGYTADFDLIFQIDYQRPETAIQVALESTQAELCAVRLAWSATVPGLLTTLYRRTPDRDWSSLGQQVADSTGRLAYEDRQIAPGGRYGYRVGVKNNCGPDVFLGETWLDVPAAPDLVLESAQAETCAPSCGVDLAWSNAGGPVGAAVLWRWTAHTDWGPVGPLDVDSDGRFRYRDTEVSPGARYGYKLAVDQCGRDRYFPEIWVEIPAAELALTSVRPNPAADEFRVGFALRDGSAARLELLDLAGRRVLAREVGGLGRGPHVLDLPGTRTLPAGVYLVRLTQGGESRTTRAALIR